MVPLSLVGCGREAPQGQASSDPTSRRGLRQFAWEIPWTLPLQAQVALAVAARLGAEAVASEAEGEAVTGVVL